MALTVVRIRLFEPPTECPEGFLVDTGRFRDDRPLDSGMQEALDRTKPAFLATLPTALPEQLLCVRLHVSSRSWYVPPQRVADIVPTCLNGKRRAGGIGWCLSEGR